VARSLPDVTVELWEGWCPTHDQVASAQVDAERMLHPDALVMVHPECRPEVVDMADAVLSTSQMLSYAVSSDADEFLVVTESGLVHALRKAAPDKHFYELSPRMLCPNMKVTTLQKVRDCLATGSGEVTVPDDIAAKALAAVKRMIAIG